MLFEVFDVQKIGQMKRDVYSKRNTDWLQCIVWTLKICGHFDQPRYEVLHKVKGQCQVNKNVNWFYFCISVSQLAEQTTIKKN